MATAAGGASATGMAGARAVRQRGAAEQHVGVRARVGVGGRRSGAHPAGMNAEAEATSAQRAKTLIISIITWSFFNFAFIYSLAFLPAFPPDTVSKLGFMIKS